MLMLSRKPGEAVRIGDEITVKVVETKKGQVKLLFDVPREIPVMRTELLSQLRDDRNERDEEDTGFSMTFLGV